MWRKMPRLRAKRPHSRDEGFGEPSTTPEVVETNPKRKIAHQENEESDLRDQPTDESLQGAWEMTKFYTEYTPAKKSYLLLTSKMRMTIRGSELVIESENGADKKSTTYRLVTDTTRSPKEFRKFSPAKPDANPFAAIYQLEGDVLLIATQEGDSPPDTFKAKENDPRRRQVEEYVRVRP